MNEVIRAFHDRPEVHALIADVEAEALANDIGGAAETSPGNAAHTELRTVATLALAEGIGDQSADQLLRSLTSADGLASNGGSIGAFEKWNAYVAALEAASQPHNVDDLIYYSAAAFLARQQVEIRTTLRNIDREILVPGRAAGGNDWAERVRDNIDSAILLIVRQADRADLAASIAAIDRLAADQKDVESAWLDDQDRPGFDALRLLAYYHVARATSRTAEFLLAGSVESGGALSSDVGPELRRLLTRADEYLAIATNLEDRFWLNAITIILWTIRTDSIWISGRGISERLDQLLVELARGERERNVFSLLPSQQDAIRGNLMDPSRIAVVLQMPTSSGKTLLAEFAILQTIDAFKDRARVVYIVPTRALATQAFRTLAEDLGPLGVEVIAASSAFEEDPYELELLRGSRGVIVATPEKLDLLLRSHLDWFDDLRLVVVDEAHLLSDSERGVRLELLLANIRRERPDSRLLLMTPFINNARDIASWLGGTRGLPITVQWRPLRVLLGLAEVTGTRRSTEFVTHWKEPYRPSARPRRVSIPAGVNKSALATTRGRISVLADKFKDLGSVLALYSGSRRDPELAASTIAAPLDLIPPRHRTAALRVAIALAEEEFGEDSVLARCLQRGVAYHHSALSHTLRYLIEDQVRVGQVRFIAATTTLAQGMNFPVASVLVHSVHKPYGRGNLSSAEFWNIAGRAGRTGMVEKGLVMFVNQEHRNHWERYAADLSSTVRSALLDVLVLAGVSGSNLKEQYRLHEELRPFIQYLAHAAASSSASRALDDLDELLQGSLANAQVQNEAQAQALRQVARSYLSELSGWSPGMLRVADQTGLGSFSFRELFAKIRSSNTLRAGPKELFARREAGMVELVEALRWLPELNLAIGKGSGEMDVAAVARVVQGWVDGRRIVELAEEFPGATREDRVRRAGTYIFRTVSQTVAWGAHAYLRGWGLGQPVGSEWETSEGAMLPAYIQHGVHTPEAAVVSLLSVPRQVAEPLAEVFRERHGQLRPEESSKIRRFIEDADSAVWARSIARSALRVAPDDLRTVWRSMRGLRP